MTVANINVRQVLLKRGNTAVSSVYTGPVGEVTVDSTVHSIRVHDGVTAGGWLQVSGTAVTHLQSEIDTINSNVGNLTVLVNGAVGNVSLLYVNAASQATSITNLWANAAIQANLIQSISDPLGNLTIVNQTVTGHDIDGDIVLAPNGVGYVSVPNLKLPVGSLVQQSASIEVIVDDLLLDQVVDYSTGEGDNLVTGDYGLLNGISGANTGWCVYRFTTTPLPALSTEDVISGVNVPANSNVLFVGTGIYSDIIITDQTIPSTDPVLLPVPGETIFTVRPIVNASLALSTLDNIDIALTVGTGGRIITHGSIAPILNDIYDLGTPTKRFRRLWLGAGSIYVQDETLGIDLRLTAIGGDFVIAGGAGLTVGQFTLHDNTIKINDPTRDIVIGIASATGNVVFNRPIKVTSGISGIEAFNVTREGLTKIATPAMILTTESALSVVGTTSGNVQPRNFTGTLLHLTAQDNTPARMSIDAFGTGTYAAIAARGARGTVDTPLQTLANDTLLRLTSQGWTSAGAFAGSIVRINMEAAEDFTATDLGTRISFQTTPVGSAVIQTTLTVDSGNVTLVNHANLKFSDGTVQSTAANSNAISANISALQGNVTTLFANAATQNSSIIDLWANAASQQTQIDSLTSDFSATDANLGSATTNITTLFSNAATQTAHLDTIDANVQAANVAISAISSSMVTAIYVGAGLTQNSHTGNVGIDSTNVQTVVGTTDQVTVTDLGSKNLTLSLPQSLATTSTVTFANLTVTGNLTVQGITTTAGSTSLLGKILYLANTATSASQIDGGGIILGNDGFARSILYDLNSNKWDTGAAGLKTLDLIATDAAISGNLFSNGTAHFGRLAMVTDYPHAAVQIDSNVNNYSQLVQQNHSAGTLSSTDFVATNDIGDDSSYYIDVGINSSNYANPDYSMVGSNDGYLYINGGDLAIATQSPGKVVKFFTSNTVTENLRATISDSGLVVNGNISVGSELYFTADSTVQTTAFLGNVSLDSVNANIAAANAAIITANSAVVSYVNSQIGSVNGNIITANTAMKGYVDLVTTAWQANAAIQEDEITSLRGNITAANIAISSLISGSYSNANVAAYLPTNSTIININANIAAANAAIITANTAMKGYVDYQTGLITTAWQANAAIQESEISGLRGNITAANAAIASLQTTGVKSILANDGIAGNVTVGNVAITNTDKGSSQFIFKNIAVSGQTTVTTTTNTDTVNLVAGSGMTITTNGKNITFVSTASGGVSSIAAGNNIVLSGATGAVTIQRVDGVQNVITANASATYSLLVTDQYFGSTRSLTGTSTVTLPLGSSIVVGRQYIIKDEGGNSGSASKRITVAASGSDTIDGAATRSITSNHGALTVLWTGTRWSVI